MHKQKSTQSPTLTSEKTNTEKTNTLDFYDALKEAVDGKKITKLEWNDTGNYGFLNEARLRLHKSDGKDYDWILNDGDMTGTDWVIL